jgi:hypothetical protein
VRTGRGSQCGFSLAELVVSLALAVLVAAVAWPLLDAGLSTSRRIPAAIDVHQNLRGAVVFLSEQLQAAGHGARSAPPGGRFSRHVPVLVPRRWGVPMPDAVTSVSGERLTVVSVPEGAAPAPLTSPVWPGDTVVTFDGNAWCGPTATCGLAAGDAAMLVDVTGRAEVARVASVASGLAVLDAPLAFGFHPDLQAALLPVEVRAIYWREAQRELRVTTGGGADVPWLDHVVAFEVRWFGVGEPPAGPSLPEGVAGCLHEADGTARLAPLGGADAVVPLPLTMLADGPWCGEGLAAFDADLLRVRRLEVALRIETPDLLLRSAGTRFLHAGLATGPHVVPDVRLRFEVSPGALQE